MSPWLVSMLVAGALVRLYLVLFTQGTTDVELWAEHARGVAEHGLVAQYHRSQLLNHPPLMAWLASRLWLFSQATGIAFRILWRIPFALADAGSALLLLRVLRDHPQRHRVLGLFALHPLAMLFSAYHGNTDSAIACALLGSLALAGEGRAASCGALLGASTWIKLPGVLAAPALFFAFPRWSQRLQFALAAALSAIAGALPVLLRDPAILYQRVLAYPGLSIHTTGGVWIWGNQIFFPLLRYTPESWRTFERAAIEGYFQHNALVAVTPIVLLAWLRRHEGTSAGIGTTIAASFATFYALSNAWAFQYLAWSIPFWFLAGSRFLVPATLIVGGYVVLVYAFVCDSPLLSGPWDFIGHPFWPTHLLLLRDGSVLVFTVASLVWFLAALRSEWRRWRV